MAHTRDQELGLDVATEPFIFHVSFPCLELEDTLLGVRDDHLFISVEKLLWHTSAELTWERLQHPDEEQWIKGWVMMH